MPSSVRLFCWACYVLSLWGCAGGETTGPGAATKLAFTVQPSTVIAGVAISPPVQVTVQDAQSNTVTSSTANITLAITSGTGTSGAVLGGALTRAAVSGVATFNDLTIDKAGTGQTLTATATGLTGATSTPFTVDVSGIATLVTGLEYPKGLWIKDGAVYLTETAGRNTSFGGKVRLSRYVVASGLLETLIDNPQNWDALVVDNAGKIYLTSYKGTIPGQDGDVSVVQLQGGLWVETHLLHLAIASNDMFLDANQDIYVIGSSDRPTAASLSLLPSPNYAANASVIATGLGRTSSLTKIASDIYYSRFVVAGQASRQVRRLTGGTDQLVIDSVIVTSLTWDGAFLYYAAGFEPGRIDRMNLTTGVIETIASGLGNPNAVRFDASSGKLYFLEGGTGGAHYKNGTLKAITNLPRSASTIR